MLLTTREYAARRGLHPRTVRLHLVEGKLPGQKIPDPVTGHPTWYVEVPDEVGDPGVRNASYPRQVFPDVYREMPDPQQERGSGWISLQEHQAIIDRYHRENIELAGRCGFYQARVQELERRVLELEAPEEVPAEMANQPTHVRNGADLGSEKGSPRPWWKFW